MFGIVNNAGIGFSHGIAWGKKVFSDTFDVNFFGVVRVTRKFMPLMTKSKGKRIIIISSVSGMFLIELIKQYVNLV